MGFGAQVVAAQKIIVFWLPGVNSAVWITVFLIIPLVFNNWNVRRYGEIEYWLTVTKIATIVGIIILGVVLPMGASSETRLLGTSPNYEVIPCPPNAAPGE